jgi:hypothetical protein
LRRAVFLASVRVDFLAIFDYLAEISGSVSVATVVGNWGPKSVERCFCDFPKIALPV